MFKLGEVSLRIYKLGELGKMSYRTLKLDELGEILVKMETLLFFVDLCQKALKVSQISTNPTNHKMSQFVKFAPGQNKLMPSLQTKKCKFSHVKKGRKNKLRRIFT